MLDGVNKIAMGACENVAIFDGKGSSRTTISTRQFFPKQMVTCVLLALTVTARYYSGRKEGRRHQEGFTISRQKADGANEPKGLIKLERADDVF